MISLVASNDLRRVLKKCAVRHFDHRDHQPSDIRQDLVHMDIAACRNLLIFQPLPIEIGARFAGEIGDLGAIHLHDVLAPVPCLATRSRT